MSDNVPVDPAATFTVATDKATYSGDAADVQLLRPVHVTGSEGSKTVVDITGADGVRVAGAVANDGVDSGNPLKIGGKVPVDSEATPTEVAVSDRVDAWFERDGALVTSNREAARQDATWTSATSADTAITIDCSRMGAVIGWAAKTGSITAGALTFEASVNGGSTWVPLSGSNGNRMQIGVSLVGSDYWNGSEAGWRFAAQGFDRLRIRLSTAITSTGSVTVSLRGVSVGVTPGVVARHQFRNQEGTITGTGTDTFDLEGTQGTPAVRIANSGTAWSGTILFQMSMDGSTWITAIAANVESFSGDGQFSTTANGTWEFTLVGGMRYLRVLGATVTNTAAIFWGVGSVGVAHVFAFSGGDKAHDATDLSTFPIKIGAKALSFGANPTGVAASDRTNLFATRAGQLFTIGGHPNIVTIEAAYTAAQTDTAVVTISTGSKIAVTQVQILADNANTVFPQVRVGFGTANTPTTTGVVLTHPGVPAGGGVSRGDGSGIIGIGADDADLRITCGVPTGGSLRVLVSYFTIEG